MVRLIRNYEFVIQSTMSLTTLCIGSNKFPVAVCTGSSKIIIVQQYFTKDLHNTENPSEISCVKRLKHSSENAF